LLEPSKQLREADDAVGQSMMVFGLGFLFVTSNGAGVMRFEPAPAYRFFTFSNGWLSAPADQLRETSFLLWRHEIAKRPAKSWPRRPSCRSQLAITSQPNPHAMATGQANYDQRFMSRRRSITRESRGAGDG